MTLASVDCYRYRVPLVAPLPLRTGTLHQRDGVLIRWRNEQGEAGWGETAPLPGFSPESIDEVEVQLREVTARWTGRAVTPDWLDLEGVWARELDALSLAASVRCGLEGACLDLLARSRGVSPAALLGAAPQACLALNGLLVRKADWQTDAKRLRDDGYSVVKLKVGRQHPDDDAVWVHAVADLLGPDIAVRLDANRAWTLEDATTFAGHLGDIALDYIEEPLANPRLLPAFAKQPGLPVALDESMVSMLPEALAEHRYARAVVLKPTFLGMIHTIRMAKTARQAGMDVVLSSAFETGVGMRLLVALASVYATAPVGLDTYRWLEEDVVEPLLPLRGACIDAAATLAHPPAVRFDRLHPINGA